MNKWMMGMALGFMAGAGLMMTSTGKALRKDVQQGVCKAKQMMQEMQ